MNVTWIEVSGYRNHPVLSWSPAPRFNLLIGPNGQGKTNLLEAVGFLVSGRSFRTRRLAELPTFGASETRVAGELVRARDERGWTVRRALVRQAAGTWQASGEGCAWARAVAFGWPDLEIVHGAPAARRAFIDGFAGRLYPAHLPALARYRQVLARRNRLLATAGGAGLGAALEPWTEQLAAVGAELVDRRRRAVAALQTELARVFAALAGGGAGTAPKIEVRYRGSLGEGADAGALREALERSRAAELRRRQTLVGPHRDDLALEIDGVDARAFASRGQQRVIALALRLAEVLPVTEAAGTPPLLLLDDALSELDAPTRARVVREAQAAEQVLLTAPEPVAVVGAARFHVRPGGVWAA